MSGIPSLNPAIASALEQLHDSFSTSSIQVKTIRNTTTNSTNANTFNSGYVKNLTTIINVYDKLLESIGLYRSQRGVTNFNVSTNNVVGSQISGTSAQINVMLSITQNQLITCSGLMNGCLSSADASALHYCNIVTAIITQLNYLTDIMNRQLAVSGSGIMTFSELFADNSGISYLDQLQLYPKI